MQMRPEIQIASMMTAMKNVVIPALALAGANKLAMEQAQLVVGMLNQMAAQLPVQFRFDRDELLRLIERSEVLQSLLVDDAATTAAINALAARRGEAIKVLEQCQRDPVDLKHAVRDLRQRIGQLVVALAKTRDLDMQLRVEKIVLELSKEQLLRDRSLVKPQGWEPDPAALPDIATLLGIAAAPR